MDTCTFNLQLYSYLTRRVEEVSSDIGLTPTAVFNVFARQFVAHRGFPFAMVTPVPTEREFTEQMDSTYLSMRGGNAAEHELIET